MSKSGWPLVEIDLDRLDGSLRGLLVLGGDERDRLALVAHLVLGEQRLVAGDAERLEVAVDEARDVLPGDDCVDALHRGSAFFVSSFVIPAWWTGERSAFAQSMLGTRTSSTNSVRPVTCATPS